ncbi:MAG: hypothetical protein KBB86_03455 [Candidatus Pacebacteria bacterium]|nr:hypothetical protein [Candidatus Paceibacterota bacterium]
MKKVIILIAMFFALSSASAQNSTKWYVTKCDYLSDVSVNESNQLVLEITQGSDVEMFDKLDTSNVPKELKIFWIIPVSNTCMAKKNQGLYQIQRIYRNKDKIYVVVTGQAYPGTNAESHSVRFLERGT